MCTTGVDGSKSQTGAYAMDPEDHSDPRIDIG